MTGKQDLERALTALGGLLGAEGSMVASVSDRIEQLPHRPVSGAGSLVRWTGCVALAIACAGAGVAAGRFTSPRPRSRQGGATAPARAGASAPGVAVRRSRAVGEPPGRQLAQSPGVGPAGTAPGIGLAEPHPERSYGAPCAPEALTAWARAVPKGRPWGPEQVTGFPDVPSAGDSARAWAASTADGQEEWLELTFKRAVQPMFVLVFENYEPGAVHKVAAFDAAGREVQVWAGRDPTPTDTPSGVSAIPVKTSFKVDRVRVYLDSVKVQGWNEIDAVGLIDTSGRLQWAAEAKAGTTYARGRPVPTEAAPQLLRRVEQLENQVRRLWVEVEKIRKGPGSGTQYR